MLQGFKNFISEHLLFDHQHKLLLALSGGADSICLFHLLLEGGFNFSVAHCNFKLRGNESDADEQFVIDLSKRNNVPFYTISFDTQAISIKEKMGIQETARNLRYEWFFGLIKEQGFYKLLTGHHLTDNVETMLINILRNTGIRGLHGIPVNENNIARPLLFTTRDEIECYLRLRNINYREDISNSSDHYLRNSLRHFVLPGLKNIQSDAEQRFFTTAQKVKSYEKMADELIKMQWLSLTENIGESIRIERGKLNDMDNKIMFLFYNLQQYGFTFSQIENISNSGQTGKRVICEKYTLSVDRNYYILQPSVKDSLKADEVIINEPTKDIELANAFITIDIIDNMHPINFREENRLYLNADTLMFPFKFRTWKEGDKLIPMGMAGYKKVSDILTDKKVENHQRKFFIVLEKYENEVIALLPDTIHNAYKVQPDTKKILSIGIKIAP